MPLRSRSFAALLAALAAVPAALADPAACEAGRVTVTTPEGAETFSVEIADDPSERARGLMFRTDLPQDAGMLFLFEQAAPRAFWMKNTPLPLDMLFIAPDGRVCGLVERAQPLTTTPRRSGCDAVAVLELNGGVAERLGLRVGARLRHPFFGEDAAWPCGE